MVFISIGRFIGIRNPLRARQARLIVSRRGAIYKILLAWLLSALISSPITILAIIDPKNIQPNSKVCLIDNQYFQIFGESIEKVCFSCVENTRHNCSLYSHACRGTWCCYSIENSLFTNFLRKKINRSSKFCIMSSFFWKKRIVCLCFRDFSGNCFGYSRGSQSRVQRMSLKTRSLETTPLR